MWRGLRVGLWNPGPKLTTVEPYLQTWNAQNTLASEFARGREFDPA